MPDRPYAEVEYPYKKISVLMPGAHGWGFVKVFGETFAATASQIALPDDIFIKTDDIWRITLTIFRKDENAFLDCLRRFCEINNVVFRSSDDQVDNQEDEE